MTVTDFYSPRLLIQTNVTGPLFGLRSFSLFSRVTSHHSVFFYPSLRLLFCPLFSSPTCKHLSVKRLVFTDKLSGFFSLNLTSFMSPFPPPFSFCLLTFLPFIYLAHISFLKLILPVIT